ncbi:MAG: ABC transporter permease [Acidobacteria bacterium]|nr:ABC transporter permease [Acidobacteriota bacterium]
MNGTLLQDLRFAARAFLRAPRFTIPAVLALALGIGATSAIFSVVRGVILKPLPYPDPDRIVVVWENNIPRNRPRNVIAPANFVEWLERQRSFDRLGMVGPTRLNVILNGQPEEIAGLSASAAAMETLGVRPVLGRLYTADEDLEGNDAVILITHEFWQTRLGGRADVLDTTITTNGLQRNIVGVMPPAFTIVGQRAAFMVPYGWTVERLRAAPGRGASHGLARLREGVSLAQATDDMKGLMAQLEKEAPRRNTGWSITLLPVHEQMVDEIRPALLILSGAVGLVLLIACVNVANLLFARSTVRQREIGLRTALGAGRGRLVRQMLTESLLLAAVGGVAGLALAVAFHRGLLALVANRIPVPRLEHVALDLPVIGFTMALALGSGLVFGLVPALVATTANDAVREGGRHGTGPRSRRILGGLVIAEVALSLVLLTGAGLLIRSFIRMQNIDPGFRSEGVFTARVQLPGTRYDNGRKISAFYRDVFSRVDTLPGVQSAGGISFMPLTGPGIGTGFYRADQPPPADGDAPVTEVRPVTPTFFRTMGIPQLAGRDFSASDDAGRPLVAVVSETLVRRHLPGENPIGKRLHVSIGPQDGMHVEIVGVVGDVKFSSLAGDVRPAIYLPHPQLAIGLVTLVVRTDMEPLSLANSVEAAVHAIDPELPLADVKTLEEIVDATLSRPRTILVLLAAFAVIAVVLAAVGVYGVIAYSVSQRTQEIGVRMALGATTRSVFGLVLGHAMRLVAIGVVVGLFAAGMASRLLETLLYDTAPLDPLTFGVTAVVLITVATFASYLPARRGTRIAPVEALRAE